MTGDGSNNMNYWVDFYSNDHQKDLSIEAELVSYGFAVTSDGFDEIIEDPKFKILLVEDYEGETYTLSDEETYRTMEILNNLYWNETLY